jgi:hypothetical protein
VDGINITPAILLRLFRGQFEHFRTIFGLVVGEVFAAKVSIALTASEQRGSSVAVELRKSLIHG